MYDLVRPLIERRLEENSLRKRIADDICSYIRHEPKASSELFYDACESLLKDSDTERILLYLPFWVLKDAPDSFRDTYLKVWYRLLCVKDVRENFHLGDCFEPDARPLGGLERVIKCAHLTPWLIKYGYLEPWNIINILEANLNDSLLHRNFSETWGYILQENIMGTRALRRLSEHARNVPERWKLEPLYVSEKRKLWLRERNAPFTPLNPNAKLEGPFSGNIPCLSRDIDEFAKVLCRNEVILLGGSKLKGYGGKNSDIDLWRLSRLQSDVGMAPGSPHAAHVYLNTLWIGKTGMQSEMERMSAEIAEEYSKLVGEPRRLSIERLESDLLLYRLLHKGYANFKSMKEFGVPEEMDGDCPFYDDGYREVATMLFAKYVWL